jgi:hypothetical protein
MATVLGYGGFKAVREIEDIYNFFPELYSWGKHRTYYFRLVKGAQAPCQSGLLPILELRESSWHYEGPEWEFFPWREEVKKVLRFCAIIEMPGICFALYRVYGDGEGESVEEKDFVLEYRAKEEKDYKPLARLRLRSSDYIQMFETAQLEYFVHEAYKRGWRVKFI